MRTARNLQCPEGALDTRRRRRRRNFSDKQLALNVLLAKTNLVLSC